MTRTERDKLLRLWNKGVRALRRHGEESWTTILADGEFQNAAFAAKTSFVYGPSATARGL